MGNPIGLMIERLRIETTGASDQNFSMPFLRNEFSKIYEDSFTMTKFSEMTHDYDQTKKKKLKLKT